MSGSALWHEQRVVELTADGLSVEQIADHLGYSVKSVKYVRNKLFRRYGASNACHLVAICLRSGLIR